MFIGKRQAQLGKLPKALPSQDFTPCQSDRIKNSIENDLCGKGKATTVVVLVLLALLAIASVTSIASVGGTVGGGGPRGDGTSSAGGGGGGAVNGEERVDGGDALVALGRRLDVGGLGGVEVLFVLRHLGRDSRDGLQRGDVLGRVGVGGRVGLLHGHAAAKGAGGCRVEAADCADVTSGGCIMVSSSCRLD